MEIWDGQMGLFDDNPQREVAPNRRVVVFDLETQRSFDEVGGRSQLDELGVSVGVAYRYDTDEYLVVTEENIEQLIDLLLDGRPGRRVQHPRFRLRGAARLHRPRPPAPADHST